MRSNGDATRPGCIAFILHRMSPKARPRICSPLEKQSFFLAAACRLLFNVSISINMTLISSITIDGFRYLVAIAFGAYLIKYYRDYNRLRTFKGPWTCGWTNLWLVRAVAGLRTHTELAAVCEKYGKWIVTSACLMRYHPALHFATVVLDTSYAHAHD